MLCDAQGRCHFCRQKHAVSVLGSDKTAHTLLQNSNLRLVVLNTVCSSCIIKLEDCISRAHTENLMRFTEPNTSIGNLENTEKSQVDENFQIQNTTDINRPISHESVQIEKAAEVGVARSIDSTNTRYKARVDIDNSQFHKNAGDTRKKQRRLICDFCQKEFNHAGDLNKHRRKHTGEKPYTCNECQYKFSHVSNLVRHQRVHSGVRPYSCQTCGRTFTRKDKLSVHLAKHHKFSKSN